MPSNTLTRATRLAVQMFALLAVLVLPGTAIQADESASTNPRHITDLSTGWHFRFGDAPADVTAAGFDDSDWQQVSVPHTWNRIGEYSTTRSASNDNRQGVGWYRLTVQAPPSARGRRQYLDFAAVAIIADVWVNGVHMGQHKGGFSRFRFDVTSAWRAGAANLIVVKADNSKPAVGSSTEHVIPLAGDFFIHGGIYRGVQLIEANDVGIDLLDFGGPGVYVTATPYLKSGLPDDAVVTIRTKVANRGQARAQLKSVVQIFDPAGRLVAQSRGNLPASRVAAGQSVMLNDSLRFENPVLWGGVSNPAQYTVKIELFDRNRLVDSVSQRFGIRSFRFDANLGFALNPHPMVPLAEQILKLRGVSRHQDRMGQGYALTRADHAEDMAIMREMGVNSVRQAHYQHADEWSDEADKAGMVAWAEVPFVTTPSFTGGEGSPELFANAEQQTRELIRQNFNHPSIMMWSVGNEVDAATLFGASRAPVQPLRLLRRLAEVAREEDPSRPTVFADCCENVQVSSMAGAAVDVASTADLSGATDLIGYNRYYGWYYPNPLQAAQQLGDKMDQFHAKHPALPISISEYGAGGALDQHSDNVLTGFINAIGRPQPEEYESYVHEQSWPVIRDRNFIWGSYVWNMFDFASDLRNEGDSVDINTKGLVSFDRKVKKDAFYYYKAQWNPAPMLWLTGKRYIDRPYPAMEVKAYTSAARASLIVNGRDLGEVACPDHICIWRDVPLAAGANTAIASAGALRDQAVWNGPDSAEGVFLNAGDIASGTSGGHLFGSDTFVTGGTPAVLNMGGFGGRRSGPPKAVAAPNPALFDYWREGDAFSYAIPVPNGNWTATVHTFEPGTDIAAGRTMTITAQSRLAVPAFSPGLAAGGPLKGLARSFPVTVRDGVLRLDFAGQGGKAVVAAIEITPRLCAVQRMRNAPDCT